MWLCNSQHESLLLGNENVLSLPHSILTCASNSRTRQVGEVSKTQKSSFDEEGGERNKILLHDTESVATNWFQAIGEIHVSFALFVLKVFSIIFPFKTKGELFS